MAQITGKATLLFDRPPRIIGAASIVGSKESDGPLGHLFDCIEEDPKFGKNTWEEAESELQLRTARKVLEKTGLTEEEVRYLFAGDLWPRASPPLTASWNCRFRCSDFTVPVPPAVKVSPWLPCVSVPVMPDV